jgi:hypothetical protein
MEEHARGTHGAANAALFFRPAKKSDPVVHLSDIVLPLLQEAIKHVQITLTTRADGSDTSATLAISTKDTSEAWGQVDTARDLRLRQNNGVQVP